ncbi:hypothetical protein HIM_08509 [Hirsutella minnesotensis 3608]|uniref:Uncharacterized protein n=1 Tax=Hirsutella minnesotensis 3608 TaxID=1043627 RepID=A0A0F8A3L8_9HYPO|nr:hypothetical protein HIM_08509 [Hirsutella minnesotensis 3608]
MASRARQWTEFFNDKIGKAVAGLEGSFDKILALLESVAVLGGISSTIDLVPLCKAEPEISKPLQSTASIRLEDLIKNITNIAQSAGLQDQSLP